VATPRQEERVDERGLIGAFIERRFLVGEIIGSGGAGIVYAAQDTAFRRHVAIKVPLLKSNAPAILIKRFLREGRAGSAIAHPNVCALFHVGPLPDGTPFLVMERLYGETLADRLAREQRMSMRDAVNIMIQVLAGLQASHRRAIVHRDLKPGNIFLCEPAGPEGFPKILDFGASKMMLARPRADPSDDELEEDLTATGFAVGTPYYMAPEQLRGDRSLDERADIFACGVIFYEMVTGLRPFEGRRVQEVFTKIIAAEPTPPHELNPAVPHELHEVLLGAITRRADDRYPHVEAFAEALDGLRVSEPHIPAPLPRESLDHLRERYHELAVLYRRSSKPPPPVAHTTHVDVPAFSEDDVTRNELPDPDGDTTARMRKGPRE